MMVLLGPLPKALLHGAENLARARWSNSIEDGEEWTCGATEHYFEGLLLSTQGETDDHVSPEICTAELTISKRTIHI
jgi:hypothetical protein